MTAFLRVPIIAVAAMAVSSSLSAGADDLPVRVRPLSDFSALRDRPLFSPNRTPPTQFVVDEPAPVEVEPEPEPEPEPELAPVAPPNWRLVGVVRSARLNSASFTVPTETNAFTLRIGESREGWTLKAVGQFDVTLEGVGGRATLRFPDEPSDQPWDWQGQPMDYYPEGETAGYGQGG